MREIKFLGCLFTKRHERCEAPYIYPVNLKKCKCTGRDFDLILFYDKVVLGLSFSVCTEKNEKKHLRERLDASLLKISHPPKG